MMSMGAAIVKPDGNKNAWNRNILSVIGNTNSTKNAVYLLISKNMPLITSIAFKVGKKYPAPNSPPSNAPASFDMGGTGMCKNG